jgi:hypothetical protein
MKLIHIKITDTQAEALAVLSPKKREGRPSAADHIRRALDMYLSTPAMQADLKAASS